ncbi:MAG: TIGR04086 family membrane protein [Oscillospiraceae bacterium]|jgi:putative membrane protein (TIGR04086 family)|nr:conserved membrane protein of unknown function [Ruminococcaceae bacterium BL-4]
MSHKKRVVAFSSTSPALNIFRAVLFGTIFGTIFCAVLLLICAWAITSIGQIPQDYLQMIILGVSGVSAFLAGLVAAKVGKKRGLILGAICGVVLFLICLLAGMLHSQIESATAVLMRLIIMSLAGALGGFVMAGKPTKIK